MELDHLYKCLCDLQRLRILNLLKEGPLCVCHLQEILDESQVKTSKQLQYLKKFGLVISQRQGIWMIYSLASPIHPLLLSNIDCLRNRSDEFPYIAQDLNIRAAILQRFANNQTECPQVVYQSACACSS